MAAGKLVREERVARSTGTVVELIDADHPDCTDYDSDEGGRWVTSCRTHGQFVQHTVWKTARNFLGHPEEWCDGCQEENPDAGGSTNGGFSKEERERGQETRRRRAAERAAKREADQEQRSAAEQLEDEWTEWTVHSPEPERVYTSAEKAAHETAGLEVTQATTAAKRAKEAHRSAEAAITNVTDLKIKSAREKKNLKRLEGEAEALDAEVVAQEDKARLASAERDRLARIAYVRGAILKGWKVVVPAKGGTFLTKGDRTIRFPGDYLAAADYFAAVPKEGDDA